MRWKSGRRSRNVEDRRGQRGRMAPKLGIGTLVIVVIALFMGVDPTQLLGLLDDAQPQAHVDDHATAVDPQQDQLADFVSVVLADTEDVWHELMGASGAAYREPTLVLFRDQVSSACGFAQSATGPFYCPADQRVYLDLSFFDDLKRRFQAPGDFAQAYVIAHEVGHHVQNLMGISDRVHRARSQLSDVEYNQLSVRLELQADFFAGVWAHHAQRARQVLDPNDLEEALVAAAAIGDDRIQRMSRGHVVPDAFTHGTSEQRVRWFKKGFESGELSAGDTFNARNLQLFPLH